MKHQPSDTLSNGNPCGLARRISKFGMAAAQAALIALGAAIAAGQTVDAATDDDGAQVLTRGPVHEAFAGIVSYNPEPGLIVEKAPPEAIEELPPEIRPVGDNISWIPGYWGWDDERSDYLWISGTWRALPPGRQWTTSYWGKTGQAYQWTSGYWADAALQETVYLPKPPLTVEDGSLPDADKSRPGREITPKPVPREEPQVKEPKREPRQEPQGMEHSDLHVRWQGRPQRIGCHGRGETPHWGRGHRCQPGRKRG